MAASPTEGGRCQTGRGRKGAARPRPGSRAKATSAAPPPGRGAARGGRRGGGPPQRGRSCRQVQEVRVAGGLQVRQSTQLSRALSRQRVADLGHQTRLDASTLRPLRPPGRRTASGGTYESSTTPPARRRPRRSAGPPGLDSMAGPVGQGVGRPPRPGAGVTLVEGRLRRTELMAAAASVAQQPSRSSVTAGGGSSTVASSLARMARRSSVRSMPTGQHPPPRRTVHHVESLWVSDADSARWWWGARAARGGKRWSGRSTRPNRRCRSTVWTRAPRFTSLQKQVGPAARQALFGYFVPAGVFEVSRQQAGDPVGVRAGRGPGPACASGRRVVGDLGTSAPSGEPTRT